MTYQINNPRTTVINGDLRDAALQRRVIDDYSGKVQLILGGIPCEWLSIRRNVGNGVGDEELEQQRATLNSVLDLVAAIGPQWYCLEDVKGLAKELPAGTPWIEIDAAAYSPQRRKRIYVGNFPRPTGVGPLLEPESKEVLKDRLRAGPFRIGARSHGREFVTSNAFSPDKAYVAPVEGKSPTICTLTSRHDPEFLVYDERLPGGVRQLEWQEAARLQGFPEDYMFFGSPTDVGTQIGRAVQIDTARVILSGIAKEAGCLSSDGVMQ